MIGYYESNMLTMSNVADLHNVVAAFTSRHMSSVLKAVSSAASRGEDMTVLPFEAMEHSTILESALKSQGFSVSGRIVTWSSESTGAAGESWKKTLKALDTRCSAYFTRQWNVWKEMVLDAMFEEQTELVLNMCDYYAKFMLDRFIEKGFKASLVETGVKLTFRSSGSSPA